MVERAKSTRSRQLSSLTTLTNHQQSRLTHACVINSKCTYRTLNKSEFILHSQQQDLWRSPECFEGRKKLYSNVGEIVSLWIEGISPVMSTIDRQRRTYDRAQYNISWGGCRKGNMLITITDVPVKQYYQEGKGRATLFKLVRTKEFTFLMLFITLL